VTASFRFVRDEESPAPTPMPFSPRWAYSKVKTIAEPASYRSRSDRSSVEPPRRSSKKPSRSLEKASRSARGQQASESTAEAAGVSEEKWELTAVGSLLLFFRGRHRNIRDVYIDSCV